MSAGKLDKRIAFESPVETEDRAGGTVRGWAAQFTVAAEYTRLRGGETVMASRLSGAQPTVIRVRVSAQARRIKTGWRGVDARSGEVFNLRAIIETDDRAYIEITAESGVAV